MAKTTINLDQPIQRGEQSIAAIDVRKPGPGELRGLKLADVVQADVDTMIVLLPRITVPTLTEAEVEAMDGADFVECVNQVVGFLGQQARRTASPSA